MYILTLKSKKFESKTLRQQHLYSSNFMQADSRHACMVIDLEL